ncbi:MAG: topoisomerase subunit [Verrucomicrobiota bacterium]|jgi:DNA gyrase subunit B/topoisomerase-4 subunit B|nr:topoisomerase subunit [Verrucomicrobiota bacterium]MDK2963881.1 topoisomerase subunit [Verrucomicrobiota bacterium]
MPNENKKHVYDESKIKTLSSLEHIRARTGMYIGRTGNGTHYDDGIYVLLKEVVDNAVDEFIMGHGKKVEITIEDDTVSVRDYGRGIPLGKVIECVSRINTGAKYNDDVFQFSVGLNGVGTKAVNALSRCFVARSYRDGQFVEARFTRGIFEAEEKGTSKNEEDGTFISFSPDPEIFKNYKYRDDHIERRLRFYAYLNAGLSIIFNGRKIISSGGLLDLIADESEFEKIYEPFHYRDKMLEFAFTHTNRFSEDYYSFVNGQYTGDGGTHLSAFREGLLKAVNEFADGRFDGDDVREGILGAVAIRLKEPIFESQTKNRLGNTEIRSDLVANIKKAVVELLHRNKPSADKLVEKIRESQKLRKELNSVKKLARERSKAVSIRVPQLKDCKKHFSKEKGTHDDTMIFITEGQSASGSLVSCRDVNTQAIYTLKGKPLNVWDLKRDALYKNVEIYNLMRSLNIEETSDGLRYRHVILATDADVDGLHIRNLMITLFLRFFEPVVRDGHLEILETPLFRARNKKETIYCYSEDERDAAVKKLGRGAEVTRFKGLGEISPGEFKTFIGKEMRLTPVEIDDDHSIPEVLTFYMGKNTQERRTYIMDNLVVDEEML